MAKSAKIMRDDWNERARTNAFHYIASWKKDWDLDSFFGSGEEDYLRLVEPFLKACSYEPSGKTMLELGCGTGRMTRSFARRFDKVFAVDVSEEMLRRARSYLVEDRNITWIQGNGSDLDGVATGTVDFAFSYIVLQHMPRPELAFRYVKEMLRTLKPGGLFWFQFNGLSLPTMNWKGRMIWGVVDLPWRFGFRKMSRRIAGYFGLDPDLSGLSWRGASIETTRMVEAVRLMGGRVTEIKGEGTAMAWVGGTRVHITS